MMLGFIGLGWMGSRMATRLVKAGHEVAVYDRTGDKARALGTLGARVLSTPGELAGEADVVFTMLADDAAVEQVLLGPDGLMAALGPGTTIVELSSVHPDTSRRVATAGRVRNVAVLDAPVSGSTPQAEDGSLVMFVGGEREDYQRCKPMLDILAGQIFYMGSHGAGATMKLVVNGLLGTGMQALAEALALGQRAGLDKAALLDVLEQTTVLAPGAKHKLQNARSETYPVQFALRLMWKDFGNVLRLAQQRAVPMPATAAAQQSFAIEQAKGMEEDFSAVIATMEELAGVFPSAKPDSPANRVKTDLSPADSTNGVHDASERAQV